MTYIGHIHAGISYISLYNCLNVYTSLAVQASGVIKDETGKKEEAKIKSRVHYIAHPIFFIKYMSLYFMLSYQFFFSGERRFEQAF